MGSRFKISAKRLAKRWKDIFKTAFAFAGVVVTIAEFAKLCGFEFVVQFCQGYFWILLLVMAFASIAINWDKLTYTVRISGSPDVEITLKVCDALAGGNAIVIPTNTTFDTRMENDFISRGSLQGQYQEKYFSDRIAELDQKLSEGLEGIAFVLLKDGRQAKVRRYPIGTVCKVSESGRKAYFLADSDINSQGIPINVDAANVMQALVCLWDSLAAIGNQEPYSIPLIGTGKAGVKDLSRDEAVKAIVFTFLAATRNNKITESLTICIHPSDYEKINWDDLCEFLKYQCVFANVKPAYLAQEGRQESTTSTNALSSGESSKKLAELDTVKPERQETLTEKEALVIALLDGNEMDLKEIAATLGVSRSYATRLLARLSNNGYVQSKGANRNRVFTASAKGASCNSSIEDLWS